MTMKVPELLLPVDGAASHNTGVDETYAQPQFYTQDVTGSPSIVEDGGAP